MVQTLLLKSSMLLQMEDQFMIVIMQIIVQILKICLNIILLMSKVLEQMNFILSIQQEMQMRVIHKKTSNSQTKCCW